MNNPRVPSSSVVSALALMNVSLVRFQLFAHAFEYESDEIDLYNQVGNICLGKIEPIERMVKARDRFKDVIQRLADLNIKDEAKTALGTPLFGTELTPSEAFIFETYEAALEDAADKIIAQLSTMLAELEIIIEEVEKGITQVVEPVL